MQGGGLEAAERQSEIQARVEGRGAAGSGVRAGQGAQAAPAKGLRFAARPEARGTGPRRPAAAWSPAASLPTPCRACCAAGPAVRHDPGHRAEAVRLRDRQGGRAAGAPPRHVAAAGSACCLAGRCTVSRKLGMAPCAARPPVHLNQRAAPPRCPRWPRCAVCGPHHGRAAGRVCLPQVERARGGDAGGGAWARGQAGQGSGLGCRQALRRLSGLAASAARSSGSCTQLLRALIASPLPSRTRTAAPRCAAGRHDVRLRPPVLQVHGPLLPGAADRPGAAPGGQG